MQEKTAPFDFPVAIHLSEMVILEYPALWGEFRAELDPGRCYSAFF